MLGPLVQRRLILRSAACQRRCFGVKNPFRVLGIPDGSSISIARKRFLELALPHHPDTDDGRDGDGGGSSAAFVRIRQAYERIRDGKGDGTPEVASGSDPTTSWTDWTEEGFLQWFFDQTGLRLTPDQRREMVNLYRSRVPGHRYEGPSWEVCRRLVEYQEIFLRQRQQQQQEQQERRHSFSTRKEGKGGSHAATNPNPMRRKRRRR